MRLLETKEMRVVEFADDAVPEYAILSHTWGAEEITYQDIQLLNNRRMAAVFNTGVKDKKGFLKVKKAANLAAKDGYSYIWIDTCCIDKSSSAELSEAINSMYRWYEESEMCYAYLFDVAAAWMQLPSDSHSTFKSSRWFTRGWTLQELIAPSHVQFYAGDWSYLGVKSHSLSSLWEGRTSLGSSAINNIGPDLLSEITGIDRRVLEGTLRPQKVGVATRMSWAALRKTTRVEDIAYSLLGIFSVNIPLLYGEGRRAFIRLQEAILRETDDQSIFAWRAQTETKLDHFSGLLADSPERFEHARGIRPLPPLLTGDNMPPTMSSQGLHVRLFLHPTRQFYRAVGGRAQYYGILDCSDKSSGVEEYPSIILQQLWGNQFARIRPNTLISFKLPTKEFDFPRGGYKAIYVQQKPVLVLPEFVIEGQSMADGETRQPYALVEVFPPDRWDPLAMSLQSVHSQMDSIMGVFGFADPAREHGEVALCVGLLNIAGSLECSYFQRPWDASTTLEEIYIELDERIRATKESLNSFRKDAILASEAIIKEVTRRGRTYVSLKVVKRAELSGGGPISYTNITGHALRPSRDHIIESLTHLLQRCSIRDQMVHTLFHRKRPGDEIRACPDAGIMFLGQSRSLLYSIPTVLWSQLEDSGDYLQLSNLEDIEAEATSFQNCRPLHLAAIGGHVDMVKQLLISGVDVHSTASGGVTALHLAAFMGHTAVIKAILAYVDDDTARKRLLLAQTEGSLELPHHLAIASDQCDEALLEALSQNNIFPNWLGAINILGELPLHRAAASRDPEVLQWLWNQIKNNADMPSNLLSRPSINTADRFGRTPLWHAAATGFEAGVSILAEAGASIDQPDKYGRTPLHIAVCEGHAEVVSILLELSADTSRVTKLLSLTACHYAAVLGHTHCLQLLISHGANINQGIPELGNLLPLHLAAAQQHSGCVKMLRDKGAVEGAAPYTFRLQTVSGRPKVMILNFNEWVTPLASTEMIRVANGYDGSFVKMGVKPIELP
jgi:ankyrin repeat protein